MSIRLATRDDVPGIQRVTIATGQVDEDAGSNRDYVLLLLDTGRVYVACEEDAVVGWAATKTTPAGSMLTDLFVHPTHQARGVGGRLLAEVWPAETAGTPRLTFSSHHASALPLYVRAGLRPFWPMLYLSGAPARLPQVAAKATRVAVELAAEAERQHTGFDRRADYAYWSRKDESSGILVHLDDRLVGAGVADASRLIHLCVMDELAADVAVLAAVRTLHSTASLCLPGPHPALIHLLEHGFVVGEQDTYMSTRRTAVPVTWVYSPGLG